MLKATFSGLVTEAGCDEAGRGCLAGPVFAAAVILPADFAVNDIDDSKKLTANQRNRLRVVIERESLSWAVAEVNNETIDRINILNASFLAMHMAIDRLSIKPDLLLIDGNRFVAYKDINHQCIIKGDGIYMAIAAASIVAKTHRDAYMIKIDEEFPQYNWKQNKGYPTPEHRQAIISHGLSPYHRLTFNYSVQMKMNLI